MRQQESVPAPRGWTGEAAWKGGGASLLLHFFVGAAMIVALSGPPKEPTQVVDLTLVAPAGTDRRPVPPAFATAEPAREDRGTTVLPEPSALPATPTVANPPDGTTPANPPDGTTPANPPDGTTPANPPDPAAKRSASVPGSPHASAAAPDTTGQGDVKAAAGSRPGPSDAGPPAADFTWIRDAIQHSIAYPAAARRMGWEGKVVVAFQLLSDGSVRDVRIVQGSGHAALDRGAIDAVRSASPFLRSPVQAEVITPVVYRLTSR